MNNYQKLPDAVLTNKVAESTTVLIEEFLTYGLTEDEVSQLDDINSQFGTAIQLAANAENTRRSLVASKNADRDEVVFKIANIAKKVYANPNVDDKLLTAAGFAPRPIYGSRSTPKAPVDLVATAFSDGRVALKWGRAGNSRSAVFNIWAKIGNGDWVLAGSTARAKITLTDFTPGQFASFRVTSELNNQVSPISNIAAIYESGTTTNLELAA